MKWSYIRLRDTFTRKTSSSENTLITYFFLGDPHPDQIKKFRKKTKNLRNRLEHFRL